MEASPLTQTSGFRLGSNAYEREHENLSSVGQIFSTFKNGWSNEILVGYNKLRDERIVPQQAIEYRMADGRELPRLRLHVLVLDDPTMARLATRLRRMYAAIGVDLILQSLPMNQVFARVVKGDRSR